MRRAAPTGLFLLLSAGVAAADSGVSAVGRDLAIREPQDRVVAVLSDVSIEARVSGDVIVWGGDVSFSPVGSVGGDLWVFGGRVLAPGERAPVDGRISTPGSLLSLYLAEVGKAPWDPYVRSSVFYGLRLIGLSAWLLVTLLLVYFFSSPAARAAARTQEDWSRTLLVGILGLLTLFLAAGAILSLLPPALSVPIAVFIGAIAVASKIFGMGVLFLLVGQRLLQSETPARRPAALAVGFAVLGALSLIPVLGSILWSAASVVAVGIAFLSRFGLPRFRVAVPRAA